MKNRYDEIMKNIEVTDEMRDRILNNIHNLDLKKTSDKVVAFPQYKKYLSIAACFVILIVGSVIIRNIIYLPNDLSIEPPVQGTASITTCDSAGELSDAVGFTVKEIQEFPFDVESIIYTSYWGELADIEYVGSENTAVFRMAVGDENEDISGYYDEFTSIKKHVANGFDVTIKGNGNQYILAIWHTDGFSYALQFRESVSEQEILDAIESMK